MAIARPRISKGKISLTVRKAELVAAEATKKLPLHYRNARPEPRVRMSTREILAWTTAIDRVNRLR